MRLLLSDSCLDSIFALPKNIQEKVIAFQRKFRKDNTTLGLHLEPIDQFKNSTLRTARIDDNYRAVIGVLGDDTYSILYISSHEKAYKWGMNKRAVWNENTDAFQLITVEETVEHVSMAQPAAPDTTPSIFSDCDDEKILKIGVPETCVERVRGIRSLDDLEQLEGILPIDAYENIFYILDGESIDSVIETVEAGKAANGQDKLLSDNNKRMFVELTDDDDLRNIIEQCLEKWQIFLHPSQRKLVNADYKGTMKVSGGAGTGKTVAAIHRLKHLCEAQDANVLFTTYTKALSVNIADAIEKLGVARDKYYLGNIDKVLIRTTPKTKSTPPALIPTP